MRIVAIAIGLAATACTVLSGIDDLHEHKGDGAADAASATSATSATSPGNGDAGAAADLSPPATSGAAACAGADGTWTECNGDVNDVSSCADRCKALGKSCVERCCAYDEGGSPYVGDAGLAYAYTTECSGSSMPTAALLGTCADPTLYVASTLPVRCCCR